MEMKGVFMLVISCHADTTFYSHSLEKYENGIVKGALDNFAGVYSVMNAFFSGRLNKDYIRIELTYGEEVNLGGAEEVFETLREHDVVFVVDVTGTETSKDFVIEKCRNKALQRFLKRTFKGLEFDLYEECPDPISCWDEVDIYSQKCEYSCMLAIPCMGGDYNREDVFCKEKSLFQVSEAICRIVENFPKFCKSQKISVW